MRRLVRRLFQLYIVIKLVITEIYVIIFRVKHDDIWLIAERVVDARDNGYFLYKKIKRDYPNIKVKYVISNDSPDYKKIDESDIIIYRSFKHFIYYLTSKILVSTHLQGYSPNSDVFIKLNYKRILPVRGKQVFLQHGITKDRMFYFDYTYNHLELFISGAIPEYEFIKKEFGFDDNHLKLTGFARFDNLINKEENMILLMPTWRFTHNRQSDNEFLNSEFFERYQNLLLSPRLAKYLEDNNIKLYFYPHHETQKFLHYFKISSSSIILASKYDYDVQDLLKRARVLITDYSSVYFDFGYMKKPIIYYQFDYEEYRKYRDEGYFDYKRDGFGPVVSDDDKLIDYLIEYYKEGLKEEYLTRITKFFKYQDQNNSQRILDEIFKLLGS